MTLSRVISLPRSSIAFPTIYGTNNPNAIDTKIQPIPSRIVPLYGAKYLANLRSCSIFCTTEAPRHREEFLKLSPCLRGSNFRICREPRRYQFPFLVVHLRRDREDAFSGTHILRGADECSGQ